MERVMNKKQLFTTLFWGAVLIGAVYWYLSYHNEIGDAIEYLRGIDAVYLLLLIPIVVLMYYAAGRIWYPYLKDDDLRPGLLGQIQYELNFVNTVVPFFSISGLVYALARLKSLGVSEGKASGMYMFRYIISIATKWIEIAIAMAILVAIGKTGEMPGWVVWITCLLAAVIILGLSLGLILFQKKVRVPERFMQSVRWRDTAMAIQKQIDNLFRTLEEILSKKEALFEAFFWGMVYSLLEVLPFWVIASAMGHPELLLQIIVASGIAITVGVIIPTPMGIGGFDGAMILFMGSMGFNVALVSAITLTTRILILVGTTVTGIPFWLDGMRSINKS